MTTTPTEWPDDGEHFKEDMDIMHKVAYATQQYVPGQLDWIARQHVGDPGRWYGFVLKGNFGTNNTGGFAYCEIEEARARQDDDTFIRELAEQVLGYAPDSEPDLMRRFREAISKELELDEQITKLKGQRIYWVNERVDIHGKLAAMGINPYEVVEQEATTPTPTPPSADAG